MVIFREKKNFIKKKFIIYIFSKDLVPLYKNDDLLLYKEFKERFKINDNKFIISNSFGISYVFFERPFDKLSDKKYKQCKFFCELFSKLPDYCETEIFKINSQYTVIFFFFLTKMNC